MIAKSEDYIKVFCNIIKSIQTSSDREQILELIVDSAVEVMQAKACSLFLIRSRRDVEGLFYPAAQTGLSEDYIHTGPARGRDITKDIVEKGGYLAIEDAATDPRMENHEQKKKEGIVSMLVVPVIAEQNPIGIMALYTAEKRIFTDQEIDFFRCLADQGGIALMRSHAKFRNRRNLQLLTRVAEHLGSSLDIEIVLHLMTSEITLAFDLLGVSIRLKDEDEDDLKLVASYGLSEEYLQKGELCKKRASSLLSDQIEVIDDINAVDIEYKEQRRKEGIVAMMHLPITVKGEVIGIMGLYDDKAQKITEDDISLMSSIARQCGMAIQNASLYLQLKNDKEDLEDEIWGHKAWF